MNVFGLVTQIYPWTNVMFKYDTFQVLPLQGYFYDHRYYWKNVYFKGIKCKCSLDLRFHDALIALTGINPYEAELQCRLKKKDVIDGVDIHEILDEIQRTFQEFHEKSIWMKKENT